MPELISESPLFYPPRPGTEDTRLPQSENILTENEKRQVLLFESKLGLRLEQIWQPQINTIELHPDYFLTPAGSQELSQILGNQLPDFADAVAAARFLTTADFAAVPTAQLDKLVGSSRNFSDQKLFNQLSRHDFGSLEGVENPFRISLLLNPEALATKLRQLREFKLELKAQANQITTSDSDQLSAALSTIITIYRRRTNELIAKHYADAIAVVDKSKTAPDSLSPAETQILSQLTGREIFTDRRRSRSLSRLDKFLHGAGVLDQSTRDFTPISQEILSLAQRLRSVAATETPPPVDFLAQSVPAETLSSYRVTAAKFQDWIQKLASDYGLLSSQPPETYDFQRSGPAPDGNWQFVIDPKRKSVAVNSRQKVVLIPASLDRSLDSLEPAGGLPLLDHEFTHVVQHVNQERLGLKITDKIGMDRSDILAEAGAVASEAQAQARIFGQTRPINLHYLSAIEARLQGGDFRQCLMAFINSCLSQQPAADRQEIAKLAIDRTRRIFRGGGRTDDTSPYVANSRVLVYLEQELLSHQAAENPKLRSLMMIGGVNLPMLLELSQFGLVDFSRLIIPRRLSADIIWPEISSSLAAPLPASTRQGS